MVFIGKMFLKPKREVLMSTPKSFMILFLSCILCFLVSSNAFATIWYVRTDGGNPSQCSGTTNAAYSGSGSNQPCALNHPAWALGAQGTQGLMAGGDTLVIDSVDHTSGKQAQYIIGYSMPNTSRSNCSFSQSYNCTMNTVPSGPSPTNPTKIVGSAYNTGCGQKPQLWGTDGLYQIFNLSGASNVDMECLELTDHSNCGFRMGNPQCTENWNSGTTSGSWARNAVYAQGGSNFSFVNMDVHGMANRGFLMGGINNLTLSYVNTDGNYMSNWDGDVGESGGVSYNKGAIVLDHVKDRFAGCSEIYPRSSSFNTADYSNCTDQNDNPPGYGDGLGMYITGGNWVITNSEFSHNTQDGLDLLYHDPAAGSVTIQDSLFEGNDGNQIKISSPAIDIENTVVIGNCTYLSDTNKVKNTSSWVSCRAGGDALLWSVGAAGTYKMYNTSIYSAGNSDLVVKDNSNTCNGTEKYTFRNNIYTGNGQASLYINQLPSNCANAALDTDYSIINNVNGATCPSGSHNKCATDPKWMLPIKTTADTNLPNVYLQSDSPAIGTGLVIQGLSILDFNGSARGNYWNMGAIQNVSTTTAPATGTGTGTGTGTTGTGTGTGTTSSGTGSGSTTTTTTGWSSTTIKFTPASTTTTTTTTTPTTTKTPTTTTTSTPTTTIITTPSSSSGNGGIVTGSSTSSTTIRIINGKITFNKN